jgi:hypothetical protein
MKPNPEDRSMKEYQVVVQFSVSKLYKVEANSEDEAAEKANDLALDEPNSLTFDSIDVIDFL